MKRYIFLLLFSAFYPLLLVAQPPTKMALQSFSGWSRDHACHAPEKQQAKHPVSVDKEPESGVQQLLKLGDLSGNCKFSNVTSDTLLLGDTLVVGAFPGDSVVISGSYFHNGPIIVLNDGYLGFKNATASIIGDVFVSGPRARLEIDSSYMFFPQLFFYQRTLLVAINGKVTIRHSTLDYSGLSHNFVATDSAQVVMEDLTYIGFTTNGFYKQAQITMNGCNQAGEYVISDSCHLSFANVNTLLLWHHVPSQASLNIAFPNGNFVQQYQFVPGQPGVSGIHYTIDVNTSSQVWWALMPAGGSSVVVQNSALRAIGLWFMGADTVSVNGLVNNSNYTAFTAGLSDRNLQLINSSVMTWSLYPMENSVVHVQSCILGEIGTMGHSICDNFSVFADGSGGYVWATDTTFLIMGFSSLSSSVRSDHSGILLLAYAAITGGQVQAQGNSIMMLLQSTLSQPPVLLDKACLWTAHIDPLTQAYAGLHLPITGTASIHKTPSSLLMDFYAYRMYYQKSGDTAWTAVGPLTLQEKNQDTLAIWNTQGLNPGSYVLKLILYDNTPDTNAVEVVNSVNLLPLFMEIQDEEESGNSVLYPNPCGDYIRISNFDYNPSQRDIRIYNATGTLVSVSSVSVEGIIRLAGLSAGLYFLDYPGGNFSGSFVMNK